MVTSRVRKILLADEREDYRERYTEFLKDTFRVTATGVGAFGDAVAIFDRHDFDLVVIGEKLVTGNGLTLLRLLRKTNAQVPIVFVGIKDSKVLEEARKAGASETILKIPWVLNTNEMRTNLFIRLGLLSE